MNRPDDASLGNHEGISFLSEDLSAPTQAALRVMGRLNACADVATRKQSLDRAFASLSRNDRYWPETLISSLSDQGIKGDVAHLVALAAAWSVDEAEVCRIIRRVNSMERDQFSETAMNTINFAVPEFSERLRSGKISSDEIFLRVALSHFFRRDPGSRIQMFVIDMAVRNLRRAMKMSVQDFVNRCLHRLDDEPVPGDAWGYLVLLREMSGRAGFFLPVPEEHMRTHVETMRSMIGGGDADKHEIANNISAAAYSGFLKKGQQGTFGALMSAALESIGMRFAILYVSEDEGGVRTRIIEMPAADVASARRMATSLPEVMMHDEFVALAERIAQMGDTLDIPGKS